MFKLKYGKVQLIFTKKLGKLSQLDDNKIIHQTIKLMNGIEHNKK